MASFNAKIEEALPALWRFARSLTGDASRADDLVQDCIERALTRRMLFLPGRPIKPWLMKIMVNIHRNQYRSSARDAGDEALDSLHDPLAHARMEDRMHLADTFTALRNLPDEQREALLTVVVGGLDYQEAAATLDIPLGTLMSRLHRARTKLKEQQASGGTVVPIARGSS